jgi:cytochrome P450
MTVHSSTRPAPTAPRLQGHPFIGNLLAFRDDPLETMRRGFELYGDVVRYNLAGRMIHAVSHPDLAQAVLVDRRDDFVKMDVDKGLGLLLGNGLVTSPENSSWLSQRRMMQPMFHRQRLAAMGDKMVLAGERMLEEWQHDGHVGQTIDVSDEMMRVTLDIITQTMFSMDKRSDASQVGEAIGVASHFITSNVQNPFASIPWLPVPGRGKFRKAEQTIDTVVESIIAMRRQEGVGQHGDLLDMLMEARDADTGEAMSARQLRDEVTTIFAAGHETTANTLAWTWYVLSQHPEIRQRLEEELETVLQGRTPAIGNLPQLPYTLQVLNEVLRVYPVIPFTVRRVARTTTLGGYAMPENSLIFLNMANIHHHPAFWDNPHTFNPDRWAADAAKRQHRLAFMPFGAGPRLCIGNNMALMEAHLLIAMIAQKYRLDLLPTTKVETEVAITMRHKGGLPMVLTAR